MCNCSELLVAMPLVISTYQTDPPCIITLLRRCATRSGAKTIKKKKNSTQNKSQTQRARAHDITSFLSTDCELSTETCSKNVYSLDPRIRTECLPSLVFSLTSNMGHCITYCDRMVCIMLVRSWGVASVSQSA